MLSCAAASEGRFIMIATDDPEAPAQNVHAEVWTGNEEDACP